MGPSYQTKIKQKRGQGTGKSYIPWIKVGEFSGKGQSVRVLGLKSSREHHFHSGFEAGLFYILDLDDEVEDVREQYPLLDIDLARSISEKAGINYPREENHVLTSDYNITFKTGDELILTMKHLADFNPRQLELFEIERQYWLQKGINWKIVTEREMPNRQCLLNFKDIHHALRGFLLDDHSDELIQRTINHIMEIQINYLEFSLPKFSQVVDNNLNITKGTTLRLIKSLVAKGIIKTNMNVPLTRGSKLIKDFKFNISDAGVIRKSDLAA